MAEKNVKEKDWIEEFLSNGPNPVLRVGRGGTVLYANRACRPLLELWNILEGETLPPEICKIARNAALLKKEEKLEVRAGERVYSVTFAPQEKGEYIILCGTEITSQKQTEEKLRMRNRQHEALSRLGELALKVPDPEDMMRETAALISSALEVEYCKILKLLPDGNFRLEAGVGWKEEVGTVFKKEAALKAGFSLLPGKPAVKQGINSEEKFQAAEPVQATGPCHAAKIAELNETASGMSVLIGSREKPFGVIAVHSTEKGNFTKEDAYFLNSVSVLVSETLERKEMEEALSYKVNFLESLLDAIPAPVFYKDLEGTYRGCNELFARRIMGLPKEKVIGRSIDELKENIPAELGDIYKRMDEQLLRRGGHQFYESKVMCSDWIKRDFFFNKAAYRDLSGEVEGLVGVMLDITGRKRTEEHLQKSEERYRIIAEQTGQVVYDLDLRSSSVEWAGAVQELTGYSCKEIQKLDFYDWLEHVHPEDRRRVQKELGKCWASGKKFHEEFRFRRKDGSYFFVENKGIYLRDEEGKVCRALGVMKDVTGIKNASERLQESEKRYRSFVQNFKGIAFKLDMNFEPLFIHGAVEEISGYREEDFLSGKVKLFQIVDPEDRQMILESRERIKSDPECLLEQEYRIRRKDGKLRWVHDIVHNICGSSGEIMFTQGSIYDITERKTAEEALAKAEEIRVKEIHHRIKNNLQVISSLLNLQAEKFKDKRVIEAFRESENRVISMALIHEELYKAGNSKSIDFTAYLRKLTEDLLQSYRMENSNIRLSLDMETISLGIDTAIPLGIVINELFSNSLKHAFPEGGEGEICIKLKTEVHAENADPGRAPGPEDGRDGKEGTENVKTGPKSGISESENLQHCELVFSDSGPGFPGGIGLKNSDTLGLQLVNALVDQIDGSIELESDAATVFRIRFPDLQ